MVRRSEDGISAAEPECLDAANERMSSTGIDGRAGLLEWKRKPFERAAQIDGRRERRQDDENSYRTILVSQPRLKYDPEGESFFVRAGIDWAVERTTSVF